MGVAGSAAGVYVGAKMITTENQKAIAENLYEYYHGDIDLKKATRMSFLGALAAFSPFIFLAALMLVLPYIPAPKNGSSEMAAVLIVGFFVWIGAGIAICQHINSKYTHYRFLQNPEKEKWYRWQYLILFEDEVDEWKEYITKKPQMRPLGIISPIIIDRHTYQIIGTLDTKKNTQEREYK